MHIFPKKFILIFTIAILLCGGLLASWPALAAPWQRQLVPECGDGGCNVCDAIGVGINITKIMLGTLGSAALLVFIYGGVLMLSSRGHSDQVQKGKDALINAVKGIIVVLGSWVAINYGIAVMLSQDVSKGAQIFGQNWSEVVCTPSKNISTGNNGTATSVCNGKPAGTPCGTGLACDGSGQCLTECEVAHSDYRCQDTTTRSGGSSGCESGLCAGSSSIQCCPIPANVCNGKPAGTPCGGGLSCDGGGQCLTECEVVYSGYRCQDTSKRTGGSLGCGADLCAGSSSILCCPIPK